MAYEEHTLIDAGGHGMAKQLLLDGLRVPIFRPTDSPMESADIYRNVSTFNIRNDDVMLCTYPKSGTNWMYEITLMLLNGKSEIASDMKITRMIEAIPEAEVDKLPSPRVLNTHLPVAWLPKQMKEMKTKTIFVARNPKDVAVSYYYHCRGLKIFDYEGEFSNFLKLFMEGKLMYGSWFQYVLDMEKAVQEDPEKCLLVYFENLKLNGEEEIWRIANFLNVPADDKLVTAINEQCRFQSLAANKVMPKGAEGSTKHQFSLFRKGEIGDWKNHFTVAESEAFDMLYQEQMRSSSLEFKFEA